MHGVEQADVDPELERVGRRDAQQLALDEPPLDLAPLRGRVAGPVGREARAELAVAEPVDGEAVDELGRPAALAERERALPARRRARPAGATRRRARSRAAPSSSSRSGGFQSAIVRSARGAPSSSTTVASTPRSDCGELAGVGDRRRGEQEARLGAVDAREPPEPPEHVRRRASRTRRGRRAPRRSRRRRGSRARRPSGRGAAARRGGACPGWSGSGSTTCGSASAARSACRRRRSRRAPSARGARASARAWSWASAFVGYR